MTFTNQQIPLYQFKLLKLCHTVNNRTNLTPITQKFIRTKLKPQNIIRIFTTNVHLFL